MDKQQHRAMSLIRRLLGHQKAQLEITVSLSFSLPAPLFQALFHHPQAASTILELNFPLTSVSTLSTDHRWNVEQVDPLRLSVSHLAGSAFCKVCIQATLELLQVHTLLTVGANSVGPLPAGAKSASIFPISTNSTQILPGGKNKSYILPGGPNGT